MTELLFSGLPVRPGCFLLPKKAYMPVWPVVACDQYTSEKEKWEEAYRLVGEAPSALKLILPECWLDESEHRVAKIRREMEKDLNEDILSERVNGMVLVERTTCSGRKTGLVLTVDLEDYSFAPGTVSLIRPTEGTVKERIPPRLKVRRDAPLELSHILILIDDPEDTVLGPLRAKRSGLRKLYDQDLMLDGGHLTGWAVEKEDDLIGTAEAFRKLKAGLPAGGILLGVGDGNHSLATARAHWDEVKAHLGEEEMKVHPARFAMAEINNIYDEALKFEPIHRVVFGQGMSGTAALLREAGLEEVGTGEDLTLLSRDEEKKYRITRPLHTLPVGTVQMLLDRAQAKIDYIHGESSVREIVKREENCCGILLKAMPKRLLFSSVAKDGPLPRKTFSMGEANEKRYYMEARMIR